MRKIKLITTFLILFSLFGNSQSPGGVSTNISLWLKADNGASTVSWLDQSGNGNNATGRAAAGGATGGFMNFNQTVAFAGASHNEAYDPPVTILNTGNTSHTFFSVGEGTGGTWLSGGTNASTGTSFFVRNSSPTGSYDFNGLGNSVPSVPSSPRIMMGAYESTTATRDAAINGGAYASVSTPATPFAFDGNNILIGHDNNTGGSIYNGTIGEVIVYNGTSLSATDQQKVNSYLSLKYGITLDQTTAQAYLASDGMTKMWDETVNTTYNNDIFGIGRDDASTLDQRVAKSINSGSIFIVALDNDFTSVNNDAGRTTAFASDLQFLTFANDGGATSTQNTEVGGNYDIRIAREWQVQNTGSVGAVNVKFDGFGGYDLISDTDGDFSTTGDQTVLATLDANGEATGVTFTDGAYLTVAKVIPAPGGVDANLSLWVKADNGASTTTWLDHSGLGNNGTGRTAAAGPTGGLLNYNESVSFAGAGLDEAYDFPISVISAGNTSHSLFSVGAGTGGGWLSGGSGGTGQAFYARNTSPSVSYDFNSLPFWKSGIGTDGRIMMAGYDASLSQRAISVNGDNPVTITATPFDLVHSPNHAIIGHDMSTGGSIYNGTIGEVIVYNETVLSAAEQQRVNSYLSLKYGITLDQTTAQAYLASDGTTKMWDETVNVVYNKDIFGVGRDDNSALNQKVAKSINSGAIFTVALDNDFTSANNDAGRTTAFASDLQFLTFANDGGGTTLQSTELDLTNYNTRITREWQVQNIGSVGAVNVKFEGFENYDLLSDADGDFSTTGDQTILGTLDANGELTGVTFSDGTYLTLAYQSPFPGGVSSNLSLWLKANDGASTSQWLDHSGNNNDATGRAAAAGPTGSFVNFNQSVAFAGASLNEAYDPPVTILNTGNTSHTLFSVGEGTGGTWLSGGTNAGTGTSFYVRNSSPTGAYDFNGLGHAVPSVPSSPRIMMGAYESTTATRDAAINGGTYVSISTPATPFAFDGNNILIGHDNNTGGSVYNGTIGEIIVYNGVTLSAIEQQRVNSYLALKYGITLDQTTATDYLASDGTTKMWDATANAAYSNDIAGIGKDNGSGLNQKQSKSINADAIVTMGLGDIATSNQLNTSSFTANRSFMVWGNDDNASTSFSATGAPSGIQKLERTWKISETQTVGNVKLTVDVDDADYDIDALTNDLLLLKGSDLSVATPLLMYDDGTNGDEVAADGIWTITNVDFEDGDLFTFAISDNPCGVNACAPSGTTTTANISCENNGWTYFSDPANPSNLLFAIEKMPVGGNTNPFTAEIELTVSNNPTDPSGLFMSVDSMTQEANFSMGRYWNVNITSGSLNGPVNVRFFYVPEELVAVQNAATNFSSIASPPLNMSDPIWFKMDGTPFHPDSMMTTTVNGGGVIEFGNLTPQTENGVTYVQMEGITSFSGGGVAVRASAQASPALPVELSHFSGEEHDCNVILKWSTESEESFSHFEVERSEDGEVFRKIATLNSNGGNSTQIYKYVDKETSRNNFYRLKMVDVDDSSDYSDIIYVEKKCEENTNSLNVFPNPTDNSDNIINIHLFTRSKSVKITLVDLNGKLVKQMYWETEEGENVLSWDISELSPSLYFLKVEDNMNVHVEEIAKLKR